MNAACRRLLLALLAVAVAPVSSRAGAAESALAWPPATRETRPWSYWWWLGSAVDSTNLTRELQRYRAAGWGGVHIIPIYGAKGWEDRYIEYLSPRWMAMLRHAVTEGERLDLGVDMTTGTGWCFGGPRVADREANAVVVVRTFDLQPGARLAEKLDRAAVQALVAFDPDGKCVELTDRLREDGAVDWAPEGGPWRVYAVTQKPSGQRVKRAAPGGAGHMLNLFYAPGMQNYLRRFDEAFDGYDGSFPRSMYHDSYEYNSNWAPDLLAQFARRRGYRLQSELPALLGKTGDDRAARVRCDYRETLSDLLIEETLPLWVNWAHDRGMRTRNQAHGSPGNLLDLYALADIPETEMFHTDRNRLISKLASSAAHVAGRRLVAAETGTWLQEHFTETLADMKFLMDDLFLSGVNHAIYHGTCYSPDEAPWPGWLFYASYEMNPRNPVWHDVPALNEYLARCQSVLQAGASDNDLLLYWPLHDFWQEPAGLEQKLTVHARGWFESQPVGQAAERLWRRGYAFDYVSDRQLALAESVPPAIRTPGGAYWAVVVPRCNLMPVSTLGRLLALAQSGATVIFEQALPEDVPGWGDLARRRAERAALLDRLPPFVGAGKDLRTATVGSGRVLVGDLETACAAAGVARETLYDREGLMCVRRRFDGGRHYFVANRGAAPFHGWLPLTARARSVAVLDPMSGRTGVGTVRAGAAGAVEVLLDLPPGASIILRAFTEHEAAGSPWRVYESAGRPVEITGTWQVRFLDGGPGLPAVFSAEELGSWAARDDAEAQRFAGTATYSIALDAPGGGATDWMLDLGRVCQSARVRLNGEELGTLLTPPFEVAVSSLKPRDNRLEVEVTSVAANRIRDLDRRKIAWKNFQDINFVNLAYKPFDAADWPLSDCGLLGPVTLHPVRVSCSP